MLYSVVALTLAFVLFVCSMVAVHYSRTKVGEARAELVEANRTIDGLAREKVFAEQRRDYANAELKRWRELAVDVSERHDRFVLRIANATAPRHPNAIADTIIADPPSVAQADRAAAESRRSHPLRDRIAVSVADDDIEPAYRAHDPELD